MNCRMPGLKRWLYQLFENSYMSVERFTKLNLVAPLNLVFTLRFIKVLSPSQCFIRTNNNNIRYSKRNLM